MAHASLGDKVEDTALALRIPGVPVLDSTVLDLCIFFRRELHNCCVELIVVVGRSCATLEVGNVRAVLCDDKGALKLASVCCVDAEVGGDLHGAPDTLGYVHKRAIGEDGGIKSCEEVVADRYLKRLPRVGKLSLKRNRCNVKKTHADMDRKQQQFTCLALLKLPKHQALKNGEQYPIPASLPAADTLLLQLIPAPQSLSERWAHHAP